MRLSRESLSEMLKNSPQDKEIIMRNALKAFASKAASTIAKSTKSRGSSKSKKSATSKVSGKSGKSKASSSTKKTVETKKSQNSGAADDLDGIEDGKEVEEQKEPDAASDVQSNDIQSHGGRGESEGESDDGNEGGDKISIIKKQRRSEKLTFMLQAASLGDIGRVKTTMTSGEVDVNSVDNMNRTGILCLLCMCLRLLVKVCKSGTSREVTKKKMIRAHIASSKATRLFVTKSHKQNQSILVSDT